jgi:hypothetical protein
MNKRGVSIIIAVTLIILIALLSISILAAWFFGLMDFFDKESKQDITSEVRSEEDIRRLTELDLLASEADKNEEFEKRLKLVAQTIEEKSHLREHDLVSFISEVEKEIDKDATTAVQFCDQSDRGLELICLQILCYTGKGGLKNQVNDRFRELSGLGELNDLEDYIKRCDLGLPPIIE